jgi:group II intron reverse transcriptase/maturase
LRELTNTGSKVQEFRRALYNKAKAEPKYRFYSLYDKTHRTDVLAEAYTRVKGNGGTCGVDGETFEDVEGKGVTGYLAELQLEMKERRYKPLPVKRVYIPKANGKERPLGIPTVRDRIVQTAFLMVLEPIFEADFADSSFGFRPERSAHGAIREIYKYLNWGCTQVYDVDLEKYFDTVEHWKLMRLVASRVADGQILHVIKQWLSCGYVEDGRHRQSKRGTPQGGVISPLLANIYLNPVDQAFKRDGLGNVSKGSIHLVRYCDDMLILAQKELGKGIALLEQYTKRLGLTINQEKTRIVQMVEEAHVDFLGFRFHHVKDRKRNRRLMLVYPSPKSQQRCRDKVRQLIHHSIPQRPKAQVEKLNPYLRGWVNYFRLGNAGATMRKIRNFVNKRVRRLIQRHRGNSGYGWGGRIGSEYIYGVLGLYCDYRVQWL